MENTKADSKEANAQKQHKEEKSKEELISMSKWIRPIPIRKMIDQEKGFQAFGQFPSIPREFSLPVPMDTNKKKFNFAYSRAVAGRGSNRALKHVFSFSYDVKKEIIRKERIKNQNKHKAFIYKKGMEYIQQSNLRSLYGLLIKVFLNYEIEVTDFELEEHELAALIEILLRKNKKICSRV